jgi:hypothetical protein
MRRLLRWVGGAVGGITAYRLLRRRPQVAFDLGAEARTADARADELRAKLAESRADEAVAKPAAEEPSAEPVAEAGVAQDQPEPESPEERRRRIHEEGRAALDEMKPD